MASLGNLQENPHIGLMFIDFVNEVIGLHVNGPPAWSSRRSCPTPIWSWPHQP